MSKTINVEYTNPTTGVQSTIQVTVDIEKYRKDTEEGAVESFFLKATATGASAIYESIDDLISDLLDGKPSKPKKGVVQALIDTKLEDPWTTLSVTPDADAAGFVADVPCVILDKYGSEIGWFTPSVVGSDFTLPAFGTDCEIGWIVQQAQNFASSEGENSQLGVKAQLEQPSAPTGVTVTGASSPLSVAFTAPSDEVIQYYDIYCIKSATEPASIEPNCLPSVADSVAVTGNSVTEYFDEDDMELKSLVTGTYFIGVVAKDGPGMVDVNESEIGWSASKSITV
jgi:hypothetical protein